MSRLMSNGALRKTTSLAALLAAMAFAPSAYSEDVAGYLYTSLNGEFENHIVRFERYESGALGAQKTYATQSLGGANRQAGGDAAGDFDSQNALHIIGSYLLAVNAGGDDISVLQIEKSTGALNRIENIDSHGQRPVSITSTLKASGENEYWVVVGNQWNNPNVQKGGEGEDTIEMYPNAAFHAEGHKALADGRNIHLFSFNSTTGKLTAEKQLDVFPGTNGGPSTVAFNEDGTKLAVTTWGIAHFATATPTHQKPSRVYVYDFDGKSGNVSGKRFFEESGISGSIGFSWGKNNPSILYVSNFNLTTDKRDHSLTVLRDEADAVSKIQSFGTGDGDDIDEACWTALSPDGDKLYVSSFGGNLISEFDIDASGRVSKIGDAENTTYVLRKDGTPPGDTKDMYITGDTEHLYVLGAYQTFTISQFDLSETGSVTLDNEYKVEAATETEPGAYNFLGLVGFDK